MKISSARRHTHTGYSLNELLIVLSLTSISLLIGLSGFNILASEARVMSQINELKRFIRIAREAAVNERATTTLCPSEDGLSCGSDWNSGYLLFIDSNRDRVINDNDRILAQHQAIPENDKLIWRVFRNKKYLQMSPLGTTRFLNGTFTYCAHEGLRFSRGLIINPQGRVRMTADNDGDQIHEGADNRPLRC